MNLIPPFSFHDHVLAPWADHASGLVWIAVMGFLVTATCGLLGNYLILRRMALVGDAISHSVLPGIVIAFLIAGSRTGIAVFLGALVAGVVTTLLIETIHSRTRVKQDAAIGIVFSTLFALGVILINVFASHVDLDADCVLYGELSFLAIEPLTGPGGAEWAPQPVLVMGAVAALVVGLIGVFYKELLVSSFDPSLAASLGVKPRFVHHALMCVLSIVVVSAFRSVGAILVVAMLILPGATAYLLAQRLPAMMALSLVHAAASTGAGLTLGLWLEIPTAAAMVVAGGALFACAWAFHAGQNALASRA